MNGEQQTANGEQQTAAMENEDEEKENEPLLSADCWFKDHGECQWADCPCECHAGD